MKIYLKKIIMIFLLVVLGILSVVRIMYVNAKQHVKEVYTYQVGETFEYNNFQLKVEEVNIYNVDDMKRMYKEIPQEVLPENEMLIKVEVKNIGNEEQVFNVIPFTLQCGIERGSSLDPYVYPYVNPELNGSVVLGKEESQTVTLAYPVNESALERKGEIKLILSLYPIKYQITL